MNVPYNGIHEGIDLTMSAVLAQSRPASLVLSMAELMPCSERICRRWISWESWSAFPTRGPRELLLVVLTPLLMDMIKVSTIEKSAAGIKRMNCNSNDRE